MKILYLSSSPTMRLTDRRGYSTHIMQIIRSLKRLGHEVLPVFGGVDSIQSQPAVTEMPGAASRIKSRLPGWLIELFRVLYDLFSDQAYFKRAQKATASFAPDLIYERYEVFHRSGIRLKKKLNIPLIMEVNAPLTERDAYYGKRKRTIAKRFEKHVLKAADAIVVVSDYIKTYLVDSGIPAAKICIIPNGVDAEHFNPAISGSWVREKYQLQDKLVLGFVGGIEQRHKIDFLLESIRLLHKQVYNMHLLIIGDGSKRDQYANFVKQNSLSKMVTFTGAVSYDDIPRYLAAIDIAVIPSTGIYCSPIKLFEYMAMQKAIIAPELETITRIVAHQKEACLVEHDNLEAFIGAILLLCRNEQLRKHLGWNARQKVIAKHTWHKNAERILKIYNSMNGAQYIDDTELK
ncbi:glycosyltransferase family 4 protein [candidate division KSB1 bacterium]|nr:glycosyltransferase family 4 protein [candidate division KSB1 bacterium]